MFAKRFFFIFSFCLFAVTQSQDQFWRNIEKALFSEIDLINNKERSQFLKGLMERVNQLNAMNQRSSNQLLIKNNQEAIQALLSVYIYIAALSRYLESETLREKISSLEKRLLNARGFPKQEEPIISEINTLQQQLNNSYSQRAIEKIITLTFKPFPFLSMHEDLIPKLAADIQNFIGNEIYFANKSLSLNDEQMGYLYRYIQIAPLISDEYAHQNGRFYLKALEEALNITNAIVQIHLKSNEKRYMVRQQELLKKLVDINTKDLIALTAIL